MTRQKMVQLVYIPFTGVGIKGYSGDEWYRYRIQVFKDYTLKSLANQTEKNFMLWLSFRPEEENNPLTSELADIIKEHGFLYAMTFNNLMYHDDKFTTGFVERIWNIGRVVRKCWWDKDWSGFADAVKELLTSQKNKTLLERLRKSLDTFKDYFKDAEWVYLTRVDSDDMFHKKAFEFIHNTPPREKFAITGSRLGLFYNKTLDQFAEYRPLTNPPVYTIIFPAKTFFDADAHMEYMKGFTSHEDIPKLFATTELPDFYYCIYTDQTKHRISTYWNHPFKGKLIQTTYNLKGDFGIC